MKEKRTVKSILIPAIILMVICLGVWIFYQEKINVVEVFPVSMLKDDWWKDYNMCQGTVTNSMVQEVEPRNGKQIEDIFVEVGQSVKTGDVLLVFDMEEEKIDMELKKTEAQEAKLALSKAEDRLAELQSETPTENEDEGYTEVQLSRLIRNKKEEISELELNYKQLQLEYEALNKQVEEATVTAAIDGIVKTINGTGVQTGEPVLVVAGEDKLYVEGVIDEFSYANVKKGSMITAISWDTGNTFQARITEISTYPETGSSYNLSSSQNPNVSYYPFTAVITDELVEVSAGETVNIGFDGISSRLFLPLAYIRSEGSKSYVYVRGGSNRLEKRAVTTGQSLYNTVIEITSGLENDDYIAFPYGNNIREGANTVISKDASDLVY